MSRRKEVEQWLRNYNLSFRLMAKKWGVSKRHVRRASMSVYDRVQNGEKIKPMCLGWEIRKEALPMRKPIMKMINKLGLWK
jgi:hypothetical protein